MFSLNRMKLVRMMSEQKPLTTGKSIVFIILIGFLVYSNGLLNAFVGDDLYQVVDNIFIRSLKNVPFFFTGSTFFNGASQSFNGIYYKPILSTFFALIYFIAGPAPFVFHLAQLLVHMANSILLFLLFKQHFKNIQALVLSIVFLVHPINSEAVLYISDTQEVLFLFFGLLTLKILTSFHSKKAIFLSGVFVFLSLLSKESGILFIPVSVIYVFLFRKNQLFKWLAVVIPVIGAYFILRINAIGIIANSTPVAPIEKLPLLTRLHHVPEIIAFYLKTFLFPINLSFSYHWTYPIITFEHFYLPLFVVVLFVSGIIYAFFWVKKQSLMRLNLYAFFVFWFFIGILLHVQILPLDATVADRWFYFPIIGVLGALGVLLEPFRINLSNKWVLMIIAALLIPFSVRTFLRSFDYRNSLTLISKDIQVSKNDYNLHNGMGDELIKTGNLSEAKEHAEISIKLNPGWNNYNLLGTVYLKLGDYENAKQMYLKALTYSDNYMTYQNLGSLTLLGGNKEDNLAFLKQTLEKFPLDSKLWLYMAIIEYQDGNVVIAKNAVANSVRYNFAKDPEVVSIYRIITNEQPLNIIFK